MNDGNFTSIAAAVQVVIDNMPVGTIFHGNELKDKVVALYPKADKCYVDTVMRKARLYRRSSFRVIDYTHSKYERI